MKTRSKYAPLKSWLENQPTDTVRVPFDELDRLVGGLPPTARNYDSYWYGRAASAPTHVWKRAWEAASFDVHRFSRSEEWVTFRRVPPKRARAASILEAAGLEPDTRAASGDYQRSADFAPGVRYCATAHIRDDLDLLGVQFHGHALEIGQRLEPVLETAGVLHHGHTNGQRTFFRATPSRGGEIDSPQMRLIRWAIAGIVASA